MSALEKLLAKCSTDAQRVTLLREALEISELEHVARERRAKNAIAKARRYMRMDGLDNADTYFVLDLRRRDR